MKKQSLLFLFLLVALLSQSQKVKLGMDGETSSQLLVSTDPVNEKHYYKSMPVSMKKDEAVVFVMTSKDFTPILALYTEKSELIKTAELKSSTKDGKEAVVSFNAYRGDTSYILYLSSAEENKTGNFLYTYKVPSAEQLVFSQDYSFCDRLNYLINHWQLYWELIGREVNLFSNLLITDDLTDDIPRKIVTNQTLVPGNKADITYGYTEKLYADPTDAALLITDTDKKYANEIKTELMLQYHKFCRDILACLDKNMWNVEKEEAPTIFKDKATHFILKGAENDEPHKSFTVYISKMSIYLSFY